MTYLTKENAKFLKSTRLNWVDTLVIAISAGFIFLLRELLFPDLGEAFDIATRTFLIYPLFYLLIVYVKDIRPILFSNENINKFLLLPKEVKNRPQFTILGLMGVMFQWVGCMIVITSPISGPWNVDELSLSTDNQLTYRANKDAERELLFEDLNNIANAKKVDTSKMSAAEIHQIIEKVNEQEKNKEQLEAQGKIYRENFIKQKSIELFPKLKKQTHDEENLIHLTAKKDSANTFFKLLKIGFILLLVGGFIDKINNLIQIHTQNKNKQSL